MSQITPEKQNWEGLWFSEKRKKKGHAYYLGLCNILRRFNISMWHLHILCFYLASRHSNSAHAISSLSHAHAAHTPFALLILKQDLNSSCFIRQLSLNAFCENDLTVKLHSITRYSMSFNLFICLSIFLTEHTETHSNWLNYCSWESKRLKVTAPLLNKPHR